MSRVDIGEAVFVHASDIQFLNEQIVDALSH
jgi:hypothetical protein